MTPGPRRRHKPLEVDSLHAICALTVGNHATLPVYVLRDGPQVVDAHPCRPPVLSPAGECPPGLLHVISGGKLGPSATPTEIPSVCESISWRGVQSPSPTAVVVNRIVVVLTRVHVLRIGVKHESISVLLDAASEGVIENLTSISVQFYTGKEVRPRPLNKHLPSLLGSNSCDENKRKYSQYLSDS